MDMVRTTPLRSAVILAIELAEGLRLSEIASAAAAPISSVQRVVESLGRSGAIERSSEGRPRYRPATGYPWRSLVEVASSELDAAEAARIRERAARLALRDPLAEVDAQVRAALATTPASPDARRWLPVAVAKIVERFAPRSIVLFGSQAAGSPGPDSDVDLLVLEPDGTDRREAAIAIMSALRDLPIAKDVIVTTPERIADRQALRGSVIEAALREGKVLYGRIGS